ncbi:MAG: DsbE family thiol:disulfide interchange protein [Pseudomonadota bacterium]
MIAPGLIALIILGAFLIALEREDAQNLPSTLINRPAPEFSLAPLRDGAPGLSTADLREPGVKLVNIWASWCGPCRVEHPYIEALAAEGVPIHGINYKDDPQSAERFLAELGDPYELIGADRTGRAGIEWGVYGVPETFVIDGEGNVIYKHIGPVQGNDIETKIRPALNKAAGLE